MRPAIGSAKQDDAYRRWPLVVDGVGETDPVHLLEHAIHAFSELPPVSEIAEGARDARVAREAGRPDVLQPDESGKSAGLLIFESAPSKSSTRMWSPPRLYERCVTAFTIASSHACSGIRVDEPKLAATLESGRCWQPPA